MLNQMANIKEGIIRINEKISKPKFEKNILNQYLIYLKKLNEFILKRQLMEN